MNWEHHSVIFDKEQDLSQMCGEHRVHGELRALFSFADISPGEPEAAGL